MANWMDGLSKTEVGGIIFVCVAGIALLIVGTALSYSTVAEVGSCLKYHDDQRVAASKRSDRQITSVRTIRSNVDQVALADDDRSGGRERIDAKQFDCHTPNRTDEIAIGYAGLWIALYAFVGALLFSVIALLTFFVGFVESRKTT